MANEDYRSLFHRASTLIAQVVKHRKGMPGRWDPLLDTQGQGEHRVACITNDQPDTYPVEDAILAFVGGNRFKGPYGPRTTTYQYLDGTRLLIDFLGPNRDPHCLSVLAAHTLPEKPGMGATGDPTVMPTVKNKG